MIDILGISVRWENRMNGVMVPMSCMALRKFWYVFGESKRRKEENLVLKGTMKKLNFGLSIVKSKRQKTATMAVGVAQR